MALALACCCDVLQMHRNVCQKHRVLVLSTATYEYNASISSNGEDENAVKIWRQRHLFLLSRTAV